MRKVCAFLLVCFLISGIVMAGTIFAQDKFPSKPITLIVPYAPGGSHDLVARALQTQMEKILKVPVLVDNRAGGGTTIGCNIVKTAPPDGYLFGTVSPTFSIIKYTIPDANIRYDQFVPIAFGVQPQGLFTHMDAPWNNLKESWIMQSQHCKLRCGNGGFGGIFHLGAIGIDRRKVAIHPYPIQGSRTGDPRSHGRPCGRYCLYDRRHAPYDQRGKPEGPGSRIAREE